LTPPLLPGRVCRADLLLFELEVFYAQFVVLGFLVLADYSLLRILVD
jgi:hypothetical protein